MAPKRKHSGPQGGKGHKKRWQSANTALSGAGIFMTCPRGKERRAANDLIDILNEYAVELYPDLSLQSLPPVKTQAPQPAIDEDDMDSLRNGGDEKREAAAHPPVDFAPPTAPDSDDVEAQLNAELAELKKNDASKFGARKKENTVPAFRLFETNTECLVFVGVHPLLDPFKLCLAYLEDIERTGDPKSRIISRLSPVAGLASASLSGLNSTAADTLPRFFPEGESGTFKIDPRVRSHDTLSRNEIIETVASHIPNRGPEGYKAELKTPSHWVVVEVFKSFAGIGVLRDYQRFSRYNASELANAVRARKEGGADGAVQGSSRVADAGAGKKVDGVGAGDRADATPGADAETKAGSDAVADAPAANGES